MDASDDPPAGHHFTVPADTAMVASLRERVGATARAAGADDAVVGDLKLAVSELATNVVQHSDAASVSVSLRHEPGRWVLDVDEADGLESLDPSLPTAVALSGRGLIIVQAVMDEVEIVEDDGHRVLRCSRLVG